MATEDNVRVRNSYRHGKGVFARRIFLPGEVIGIISGVVEGIPDPECEFTCWFEDDNGNWFTVNPEPPFKFLNHDNEPNADWSSPVLIATEHISKDQEITIHYGEEFEEWTNEWNEDWEED